MGTQNVDLLKTVTGKILSKHVVEGKLVQGEKIGIRIDQTLTQDATGTMAYLEAEALGINQAKTELSVSYIDHNTLKQDFKNADDHVFLQTIAAKLGIVLSKAGNGICHQVHLERFARPGRTLLGSDSHTPTGGGLGSIAIGAGGLDVALAIGGRPFYLKAPSVVGIKLVGNLKPMVAAKDIILEVLNKLDVKGGVGKVLEYYGPGVDTLSVPERAVITNMGAETGATTSVFPSDNLTKQFLIQHGREDQWEEIIADKDVAYDENVEINLDQLVPMVARPHSPGSICTVKEVEGTKIDQVCIGSCTNSSYKDLVTAAMLLKGKTVNENISLTISPGSMSVFSMLAENGHLSSLIASGARILECTCGPCIGQGQSPKTGATSVRTFNRNFKGRSGTKDANVFLTSVETAVSCALSGEIKDPRSMDAIGEVQIPKKMKMQDSLLVFPPKSEDERKNIEVIKGPNIKSLSVKEDMPNNLVGETLIKLEDNITTDHIMPAGIYLPLRSNVPEYSKHVLEPCDPDFYDNAKAKNGGFIIAGDNYGQGSSREHAALCPSYLGVKAVICKAFARIHLANLINFGILPLTFIDPSDYDKIDKGDQLDIDVSKLEDNNIVLKNVTKGIDIKVNHELSGLDEVAVLRNGGMISHIRKGN